MEFCGNYVGAGMFAELLWAPSLVTFQIKQREALLPASVSSGPQRTATGTQLAGSGYPKSTGAQVSVGACTAGY